ncbi:MAG: type II toxin-antitoxin system prevent-host-death family antitoxin [Gemmatimonadetes bacterium]|nr:type II toxin-antitoxin system prevent-host-death family antitoxin [Gemmatimonadota bacterium]
METIPVSELRANLMQVLKRIESGASITITSRGREMAHLIPPENPLGKARELLKELRKTAVVEDVLSPTGEEWEAMQ